MGEPRATLQIENVVGSTAIEQEVDLDALADALPRAQFAPDQFPGLVYRTSEPTASCLLFRSGKLVVTGASSVAELHDAGATVCDALSDLGLAVPDDPEVIVQNVVSTGDFGQPLTLSGVAIGLGLEHVEYEPEQFPGLVYRPPEGGVVILLFSSGKVVVTGVTQRADAEDALERLHAELVDLGLLD